MSLKNVLIRTINKRNKFVNIASTGVRFYHEQHSHKDQEQQYRHYEKAIAAALVGSVFLAKYLKDKAVNEELLSKKEESAANDGVSEIIEAGQKRPDLPVFRAEEVAKHDSKVKFSLGCLSFVLYEESRCIVRPLDLGQPEVRTDGCAEDSFWVIYRHGVYDVTKFLPSHPGGEQILNAGGLSVEPFWNVYGMHKTKDIYQLLESYRIGNLHDDDMSDYSDDELWVREPVRDRRLIVKTKKPFNAEIPAKLIIQNFDTPNELFYVRQHMPVPELEAQEHTLRISIDDGPGPRNKSFNLQELQKLFPPGEVRATLMCAGNRRSDMNKVKPVKGIDWQQGAICNAVWTGVYLRDVLVYCGVDTSNTAGKHVVFTGSDVDATGVNFSTSIPLDLALNPNGQIMLATHMNGELLPKDHGYPLRVIVPGAPAVRSVKWLESIRVSFDESSSHWHQKDYRSFNASKTWETADFPSAPPLYSLPVTSAICDPADGDVCTVKDGVIEVRGYAYSGGGAKIIRVDISPDCGATWYDAQELQSDEAPHTRHYSWTLWTARIPVKEGQTEMELWAKATDSNFNTQPEKFQDIWNIRGLLGNAYHRIKVQIKQ